MNEIEAKKLYDQRDKRVKDAVALKTPDRIPIITCMEAFPAANAGVPLEDCMRDFDICKKVYDKFFDEFDPDLAWDPTLMYPLNALDTLDYELMAWPGDKSGRLDRDSLYQFTAKSTMDAEEYGEWTSDPTKFMLTKWMPRSFGALKGLSKLGGLNYSMKYGWMGSFSAFGDQDVIEAFETLAKAGKQLKEWLAFIGEYDKELIKKGFPLAFGAQADCPFDMLCDSMRGTINSLTDIYEHEDEMLMAMDAALPIALGNTIAQAKASTSPYVWIWLHNGMDSFMSNESYKKFYWPTLRKMVCGLVDAGLTPVVYTEGKYNTRLEILRDVPVGKVIYHFEDVDMARAKDVLKDVACISGNLSATTLQFGTPDQVKEECKYLIDTCGKGGGYIMDTNGCLDKAKPENVHAMFDFVHEYGRY